MQFLHECTTNLMTPSSFQHEAAILLQKGKYAKNVNRTGKVYLAFYAYELCRITRSPDSVFFLCLDFQLMGSFGIFQEAMKTAQIFQNVVFKIFQKLKGMGTY